MNVYWIASATANPPLRFSQDECFAMAAYASQSEEVSRRASILFKAAKVSHRYAWVDPQKPLLKTPDELHQRYLTGLAQIAPKAATLALQTAGLRSGQIDHLVFVSCTGFSVPSYGVALAKELELPNSTSVSSLLGMGCSALLPGLQRAHDFVACRPGTRALVVAAEICSATYWLDEDPETMVGNALFGDGAAAVVLSSAREDLTLSQTSSIIGRIDGFSTVRDTRYIDDMGFSQSQGRLRVRLAQSIPTHIVPLVLESLRRLELSPGARLVVHPGGPKILDEIECQIGPLPALNWSRETLRDFGNMSSPTVAFVLARSFERRPLPPLGLEPPGALITMGPGFTVESMRVQWGVPESF